MNKNNRIKITLRQKTILVIFGLFLTLVILETGLRLGGFIILSLQEHSNLLSVRQRGEYRILCLGESTTQNQYPSFLEAILNQKNIGIKFSVIDKGLVGTDTGFIVSQLGANLDKYRPDLVVTMMGVNDYEAQLYEIGSTAKVIVFFKSLRIYKLTKLLWLHIITKAQETGFYRPENNNKKSLALNPQNDKAYEELSWVYMTQGKLAETEEALKKSLALNPQNDKAYEELGWVYMTQGKLAETEEALKKSLALNPQNDKAYEELGWFSVTQGKFAEAEEALKKSLALNPQNDKAYEELGWVYMTQGRLAEAEGALKKSLALSPPNDKAYGRLTVVYGEKGNYILSKEYEEKAKQIRERFYNPMTINNYRRCKQILNRRKIEWICVQYPVRSIEPLKKILEGEEGIFFVDNEEIFKSAIQKEGYKAYFRDIFAGDFGHCTHKGNQLLAENIANVILKEVFGK